MMVAPRAWTTETLMKRVNQFVEESPLNESATVADLFDEMESTIVFEKTGVQRRKRETATESVVLHDLPGPASLGD